MNKRAEQGKREREIKYGSGKQQDEERKICCNQKGWFEFLKRARVEVP